MKVSGALILLLVEDATQFALLLRTGSQDHAHALHRGTGVEAAHIDYCAGGETLSYDLGHVSVERDPFAVVHLPGDASLGARRSCNACSKCCR